MAQVSFQERLLFTKHLGVMVKAGIPLTDSLDTLAKQTKIPKFRSILETCEREVENGQTLSHALQKFPKAFDELYISMVEVGEESGTLEESLEFLAKQQGKEYALRRKIQAASFYPALVVAATGIMGGFITFLVLPKLVDFFGAFEIELPAATRALLFFANFAKNYGIFLAILLPVILLLLRVLTRLPKVRPIWHTFLLKIPLMGNLISYGQLARFSRNLGTLLTVGISVTESLKVTAKSLSNLKFRNDLTEILKSLIKGKSIGDTMSMESFWQFPPLVSKMISVGEKTGKLDETLLYLGDFYESEIDNISKNLTTIIEPILLIAIGLVVGFVALAIISPIYELTGSIR